MLKRILVLSIAAVPALAAFSGCGEKEEVDPYATVTVHQATRGHVVSKGFKYKFVNPQIEVLHGNLGLIREGNLLEFVTGRSLEAKLEGKTGGQLTLNCVKKYSPYVHFRVDAIIAEGDTIFPPSAQPVTVPRIMTPDEFGVAAYEDKSISSIPVNNTMVLNQLKDKKLRLRAKVVPETVEGKTVYWLEGGGTRLRVADAEHEWLDLMLTLCAQKGYEFDGGVIFTEIESLASRMKSNIAGTVDVQYVMYGPKLITS